MRTREIIAKEERMKHPFDWELFTNVLDLIIYKKRSLEDACAKIGVERDKLVSMSRDAGIYASRLKHRELDYLLHLKRMVQGKNTCGEVMDSHGAFKRCEWCQLRFDCEDSFASGNALSCSNYKVDIAERTKQYRLNKMHRLTIMRNINLDEE